MLCVFRCHSIRGSPLYCAKPDHTHTINTQTHSTNTQETADAPTRVCSDPTAKALTRLSRNIRTKRKLILPMLHDPSTRITISAMAGVLHVNTSTEETEQTPDETVLTTEYILAQGLRSESSRSAQRMNDTNTQECSRTSLFQFWTDRCFCYNTTVSDDPEPPLNRIKDALACRETFRSRATDQHYTAYRIA